MNTYNQLVIALLFINLVGVFTTAVYTHNYLFFSKTLTPLKQWARANPKKAFIFNVFAVQAYIFYILYLLWVDSNTPIVLDNTNK